MYIDDVSPQELQSKRRELDMTQQELADKLKVTRNTVARWERGEMAIPTYLDLAVETIERNFINELNNDSLQIDELIRIGQESFEDRVWVNEILKRLGLPPIE